MIGYAKRALEAGSRERLRMREYADALGGLHMIVFTLKRDGLPAEVKDGNLHVYGTNAKTRIGALWKAFRLGRAILKDRPAKAWIVSTQDPGATALVGRAVAKGNRATNHIQIHGDVFSLYNSRSLFARVRVWYAERVVRTTAHIRVVSERIKRSLVSRGVAASFVTVLPIQADLSSFLTVGNVRQYTRAQPLKFVYVGRLSPEKNVQLLIDAFEKVRKQHDCTLTIVGAGPMRSALQSKVMQLALTDSVTFMDWTNDIASVLAAHDVLCLSSDHEGWGMVLVEAAAAGMPVVTTDVGCAGEFVVPGVTGQVVPVGDVVAFAGAMSTYCDTPDLIRAHGQAAHAAAVQFALGEEEYLKRFVDVYTSV